MTYDMPDMIELAPELQRFSTVCDILGRIPHISASMAERYLPPSFVDTSTAST